MGTGSLPRGKERPGRDADPSPPSSAVRHERVELYLYSPYGPYGLYRASVSGQGWPLPLPFSFHYLPVPHFTVCSYNKIFNITSTWFPYQCYRWNVIRNYSQYCDMIKRQSNPIRDLDRSWGFQEVETPRFQDNRHMKVVRLSALCTA